MVRSNSRCEPRHPHRTSCRKYSFPYFANTNSLNYLDTSAVNGTAYYYKVTALYGTKESAKKGIESVKENASSAKVEDLTEAHGDAKPTAKPTPRT